jgi:hypothetical protein
MKKTCILMMAVTAIHAAQAADSVNGSTAAPPATPASAPVTTIANGDFCLYAGSPPSDFKFRSIGRVRLGKGTYGGVREELPGFVSEARAKGADAVISYNGAQRFGFWPWRFVRPVLTGVAIKFDEGKVPDCLASGGSTLTTVLATNQEPARR